MKICVDCGRNLFDYDELCDRCNSKNIISEKKYNEIIEEIKCANIFKKKKLLQNNNYRILYNRLQQPEKEYPVPEILRKNNCKTVEYNKEYWDRINNHTINKSQLQELVIECPYCHSKDVKKITVTSKVIDTAVWGVFGTKRYKQWHCYQCNSDF